MCVQAEPGYVLKERQGQQVVFLGTSGLSSSECTGGLSNSTLSSCVPEVLHAHAALQEKPVGNKHPWGGFYGYLGSKV